MKKWFLIAAAALTAGGLFLMGGAFLAAGMDFSRFDTSRYEDKYYSVDEEFQNIDIQAGDADVTLEYAEPRSVRTETAEVFCTEREKTAYSVRVENGTLTISLDDQRKWYDYIAMFSKKMAVKVVLPLREYGTLKIRGETGDITVPGDFSFGRTDITASTGDIAYSASVRDDLNLKTSTGNIGIRDLSAGAIGMSVSTGKVTAESVSCEGEVSVRVSTGRTELSRLTCANLSSEGDTGRITLSHVDASGSFDITRSTGNVSFESCDADSISVSTSTGNVTGTLRSEKIFFAKTSTGSVHVPECMTGGRCDIKTSTGNIDIEIAG